jgi:type II secretory pathway component GspD/PulD (secretin)
MKNASWGFLADRGLGLAPPCTMFGKERGLVIIRAPRAKIEAIEKLFAELNNGRPHSEVPYPAPPPDRETITRKLDQIRIDSPAYNGTPLLEVVRDLTWATKNRDPERKGFAFYIKYTAERGKMVDLSAVKVTVAAFSNVRLSDLLEAIVKGADKSINYHIWAGVAFYAKGEEPALPLGMSVGDGLAKSGGAGAALSPGSETNLVSRSPLGDGDYRDRVPLDNALLRTRVFRLNTNTFPAAVLKRAGLSETNDMSQLRAGLTDTNGMARLSAAFRRLLGDIGVDLQPPRTIFYSSRKGTLMVHALPEELDRIDALLRELADVPPQITVEAKFNQPTASTNNLNTEAAKLVQSGRLLQEAGNLDDAEADLRKAITLDPQNRAAVYYLELIKEIRQRQATEEARLNRNRTRVQLPEGTPGKSETTSPTNAALFTRVFKIDLNTLFRNLEEHGYLSQAQVLELSAAQKSWGTPQREEDSRLIPRTNSPGPGFLAIRAFLSNAGLELKPPESMFLNDRRGTLFVRATSSDLDLIQTLIGELSYTPPLISLESKFIEMPEGDYVDLWAKWTPLSRSATGAWTVVLTSAQARELVNGLKAKPNVDIITGPSVTTLSGRQAQVQMVDIKTIVTGINPKARNAPGVASADGTNGVLQTERMPFGPVLDLVPTLSQDGYTLELRVLPTVTEFVGYDESHANVPVYVNGKKQQGFQPLPRFRVRQTTTSAVAWDGQTVMVGNAMPVEIFTKPDGTSAATPATDKSLKRLIVLVTPTITDPAGNRVHVEEEMPFAREGVPTQPSSLIGNEDHLPGIFKTP